MELEKKPLKLLNIKNLNIQITQFYSFNIILILFFETISHILYVDFKFAM